MKSFLLTLSLLTFTFVGLYSQQEAPTEEDKHIAFRYLQRKLGPEVANAKWSAALAKMNIFEDDFKGYAPFETLKDILKAPATGIQKELLPGSMHTQAEETVPVLSADGKTLYFCRMDYSQQEGLEDIYTATLQNNEWQSVKKVEKLSNPYLNDAPLSVSADGTRMFLFINGRIAYSDKTADSWTAPEFMKFPLNNQQWQSDARLTADGQALLLTIRDDETEDDDIFVALRQDDGSWGAPINLGSTINTPFAERTALLHPDMKTLYFSSAGHAGLGGLDVYKSTRLGDGWDQWSTPVNLGKEINTVYNDWGYSITTDGQYAVFSSKNRANEDLYRIQLPENMRPEPVTAISGKIEGLKEGSSARVLLFDEEGNKTGEHRSDPRTGEYFIILPSGIAPIVKIEGEGLVSAPKKIIVAPEDADGLAEVKESINVVDLNDVGDEEVAFTFEDVLFATDQYSIREGFSATLDEIAKIVKSKGLNLIIEGHTDNTGNAAYNKKLSQNRAEAVREYLIAQGCDADKIAAIGYGEEKPTSTNDTAAGRSKNRRVELKFSKQ
jgi:outer membrane protein OmpA-like peptidoglycan-associated protein